MRFTLALLILTTLSIPGWCKPRGQEVHPNPLLKTSNAKFLPVAKEILKQDTIGLMKPVNQGGVSAAHVIYVDSSDQELAKEMKEQGRMSNDIAGGADADFYFSLQDVRKSVAEAAADNKAAQDAHGVWRSDPGFYEPYATDPRLYQRAVRLLGKPTVAPHKKTAIEKANEKTKAVNDFLGKLTGKGG